MKRLYDVEYTWGLDTSVLDETRIKKFIRIAKLFLVDNTTARAPQLTASKSLKQRLSIVFIALGRCVSGQKPPNSAQPPRCGAWMPHLYPRHLSPYFNFFKDSAVKTLIPSGFWVTIQQTLYTILKSLVQASQHNKNHIKWTTAVTTRFI